MTDEQARETDRHGETGGRVGDQGHRDPYFGRRVEEAAAELWEAETDSLSARQVRDLLQRLRRLPGVRPLVDGLEEIGIDRIRVALMQLLASPADRPIDPFGLDRLFYEEIYPAFRWIHDNYFRVETTGVEHIPDHGRVLLAANHSGTLPYDAAMVATTVRANHPARRLVRPLVEDFVYHMPWLGKFMARAGAVRACQENARDLLEEDGVVLVFPEGVKGIGKLYRKRYRLQRFGRGGSIRLALKTGAPIVPCAIVGAEEAMPLLGKVTWLARPLGLPYVPVTPTLPHLGPIGAVPLPTKWYVDFGPPMDLGEYGPEAARDRVLVNRLNEQLRDTIQEMVRRRLEHRQSVFFG